MEKPMSSTARTFVDSGRATESQINSFELLEVVKQLRATRAAGTLDKVAIVELDFWEYGTALADAIKVAVEVLEICQDSATAFLVFTFPSPHRLTQFEATAKGLQYRYGSNEVISNTSEGWATYPPLVSRLFATKAKLFTDLK